MTSCVHDFDDVFDNLFGSTSLLDRKITFTKFEDRGARRKKEAHISLRTFADTIASIEAPKKDSLPLFKLARFGSSATEKGSLRNNANVLAVTGCEADYDGEQMSLEEARDRLQQANITAVLYASPSHSGDAPRWRVFAPFSEEVEPDGRDAHMRRLCGIFGGGLDGSSFVLSQAFYAGTVAGRPPIAIYLIDGARFIDEADDLDEKALGKNQLAHGSGERDASGSGALYTLARRTKTARQTVEDFREAIVSDARAAAHVAKEEKAGRGRGERAIIRAWDRAPAPSSLDFDEEDPEDFETAKPESKCDPIVASLNRLHAVVAHQGRTLITTEDPDGLVNFGTATDLHTFYANQRRIVPGGKTERTEPISQYWLRHSERRTFPRGVAFAPGTSPKGALNLWRGWAVAPNPSASCQLLLNHIREVVCCGNSDHEAYVLGWLAHLVQQPDKKPGVALVLRGGKGAGKDTLADYLARVIGRRHVPTVSHENHIVGNFNRRLEAAMVLHVQEGSWAGDRKAEGVLKYLVTSDTVEIERKGIDSFSLPSFVRLFISSNAEWAVPASADERRWAVFNVSDARQGDSAYFSALRAEMHGEGPAALLAWLEAYDLTGFDVRKAPDTEGLTEQKIASLKNLEAWWHEVLNRGEVSGGMDYLHDWQTEPLQINCDTLREVYTRWLRDHRFQGEPANEIQFGRRMHNLVPSLKLVRPGGKPRPPRKYVMPVLDDCRALFAKYLGGAVSWS